MGGECRGIIVTERQVGLLQDLTAIGITQPGARKRLTSEISKLSIGDGIPQITPVRTCIPTLSALSDKLTKYTTGWKIFVSYIIVSGYSRRSGVCDLCFLQIHFM